MNRYVLGFIFDKLDYDPQVVLIRKKHPAWQLNRLNGVGGHIEPGEDRYDAITRKCKQETGVLIDTFEWDQFALLTGDDFEVHCFKVIDRTFYKRAKTMTPERLEKWSVAKLLTRYYSRAVNDLMIDNLAWLIPAALDIGYKESGSPVIKADYTLVANFDT